MTETERKAHWEHIYQTKQLTEVSWFQPTPSTSLEFIHKTGASKDLKIIDVGGGDSFLVDHLIELGYSNITVLDISVAAIQRAKERLGKNAAKVTWVVSDIVLFETDERYDIWHDRAAFHFLTNSKDIQIYTDKVRSFINSNGKIVIATFAENGPLKCSGIQITQYSEAKLQKVFERDWEQIEGRHVMHPTPFNSEQAFVFASFKKKS